MKIKKDLVVSIHFGVTEVDGNTLDSTENGAPLDFIQGAGYLVSGLEKELEGKMVGDKFDVKLEAKDAYGEFREDLVQQVPLDLFEGDEKVEVGMSFQAETDQGQRTVEVTAVSDDMVSIDANHPLAGMSLQFVGEVVAIREATEEELAHGHIHQADSSCSNHETPNEHQCCGGDHSKHTTGEHCCSDEPTKEEKKETHSCCGNCH